MVFLDLCELCMNNVNYVFELFLCKVGWTGKLVYHLHQGRWQRGGRGAACRATPGNWNCLLKFLLLKSLQIYGLIFQTCAPLEKIVGAGLDLHIHNYSTQRSYQNLVRFFCTTLLVCVAPDSELECPELDSGRRRGCALTPRNSDRSWKFSVALPRSLDGTGPGHGQSAGLLWHRLETL